MGYLRRCGVKIPQGYNSSNNRNNQQQPSRITTDANDNNSNTSTTTTPTSSPPAFISLDDPDCVDLSGTAVALALIIPMIVIAAFAVFGAYYHRPKDTLARRTVEDGELQQGSEAGGNLEEENTYAGWDGDDQNQNHASGAQVQPYPNNDSYYHDGEEGGGQIVIDDHRGHNTMSHYRAYDDNNNLHTTIDDADNDNKNNNNNNRLLDLGELLHRENTLTADDAARGHNDNGDDGVGALVQLSTYDKFDYSRLDDDSRGDSSNAMDISFPDSPRHLHPSHGGRRSAAAGRWSANAAGAAGAAGNGRIKNKKERSYSSSILGSSVLLTPRNGGGGQNRNVRSHTAGNASSRRLPGSRLVQPKSELLDDLCIEMLPSNNSKNDNSNDLQTENTLTLEIDDDVRREQNSEHNSNNSKQQQQQQSTGIVKGLRRMSKIFHLKKKDDGEGFAPPPAAARLNAVNAPTINFGHLGNHLVSVNSQNSRRESQKSGSSEWGQYRHHTSENNSIATTSNGTSRQPSMAVRGGSPPTLPPMTVKSPDTDDTHHFKNIESNVSFTTAHRVPGAGANTGSMVNHNGSMVAADSRRANRSASVYCNPNHPRNKQHNADGGQNNPMASTASFLGAQSNASFAAAGLRNRSATVYQNPHHPSNRQRETSSRSPEPSGGQGGKSNVSRGRSGERKSKSQQGDGKSLKPSMTFVAQQQVEQLLIDKFVLNESFAM